MRKTVSWDKVYTLPIRIIAHLMFWGIFTSVFTLVYNRYNSDATWAFVAKDMFVVVTIFYSTAYIIIPHWLIKGKYFLSFLWVILCYSWWCLITYWTCLWVYDNYELHGNLKNYVDLVRERGIRAAFTWENIPFYLLDFSFLVSLPMGLKLTQTFVYQRIKKVELEKENLYLELNYLKSQINPHFLFNSLNNIHYLSIKNDPRTSESILSLADLMKYTLYESNKPFVPLRNEINFINNLIALERLRFDKKTQVSYSTSIDDDSLKIAPLIIIPFIENVFKHTHSKSNKPGWININLTTNNGLLTLETSNSRSIQTEKIKIGGIGIANARKRLNLNYRNNYTSDVEENEESYYTKLTINLL